MIDLENRVTAVETKLAPPPEPLPPHDASRGPRDHHLTAEQSLAIAGALREQGIDAPRVDAAVKASGFEVPIVEADTRSGDAIAYDQVFAPPTSPAEYKIDWYGRTGDLDTAGLAAFDSGVKTWAQDLGLNASIGTSVIEIAIDTGLTLASMHRAEREAWTAEQANILEAYASNHNLSADYLRKAANATLDFGPEAVTKEFRDRGVFENATLIVQLYLQGSRLAYKQGLKGG